MSDLAMCFYEDGSSTKANLHGYTLLYVLAVSTAFFVVLFVFLFITLKKKYDKPQSTN